MSQANNWTQGRIFQTIIEKERKGSFLGKTIQIIPHVTDQIKEAIRAGTEGDASPDVMIIEIGGTVGDIESQAFLEAIRQLRLDLGVENTLYVHLSLVPFIASSGELKTKPTQATVRDLRNAGIIPDVLLCRADRPLSHELRQKISLFTSVPPNSVIAAEDVQSIYEIPVIFHNQQLDHLIISKLQLNDRAATVADLDAWKAILQRIQKPTGPTVQIAIVGKYIDLQDSYKSLREAITHAAAAADLNTNVHWINSEELVDIPTTLNTLNFADGIIVPGGFGKRGTEGIIHAIGFARELSTPFLGICFGMQLACVEFASVICEIEDANSAELDPNTKNPIICKLRDLAGVEDLGGTMRLGSYPCRLTSGSIASQVYKSLDIKERHRHRYEFNPTYREALEI